MNGTADPQPVRGGPFAELLRSGGKALRKPPKVVELPLTAWADGHSDKPAAPIPIGLRLLSSEERQRAADEADKAVAVFASQADEDGQTRAYNSALIAELVASAACQAADVTVGFFEMASLDVRRRLTASGIQRLWQELQALEAASEAAMPELDVEGLAHLVAMLDRDVAFAQMPREEARRLKRLLEHVRVAMQEAELRAERAGVAIVGFGSAEPREEPRADLENVLAALERRKR